MSASIFTRTFSYRQRDNISPLENYLTEIFSFCLENDKNFRNDFFQKTLNLKIEPTEITISTQGNYESYGRPDIEITYDDTAILFECKVEAKERQDQLKDYSSILIEKKAKYKNLHLVFLSKYYENKENDNSKVQLHLVRWFEVYELINEKHSEITQQLKSFLKEQNMEKVKNFTIQDLLAMKTIPETISKMDELLEQFKPEFKRLFGGYSKESSRSSRLPRSCYINYVSLKYQNKEYALLIGFDWDYEDEIPYLGLTIEIVKKKFEYSDIFEILNKELVNKSKWDNIDYGTVIHYSILKPITEFISQEEDNIPTMKKFIDENLKTLVELKAKYPKLLSK